VLASSTSRQIRENPQSGTVSDRIGRNTAFDSPNSFPAPSVDGSTLDGQRGMPHINGSPDQFLPTDRWKEANKALGSPVCAAGCHESDNLYTACDNSAVQGLHKLSNLSVLATLLPAPFGGLFQPLDQMGAFSGTVEAPTREIARHLEALRDIADSFPSCLSASIHGSVPQPMTMASVVHSSPIRGLLHDQHQRHNMSTDPARLAHHVPDSSVDLGAHLCHAEQDATSARASREVPLPSQHNSYDLGQLPSNSSPQPILLNAEGREAGHVKLNNPHQLDQESLSLSPASLLLNAAECQPSEHDIPWMPVMPSVHHDSTRMPQAFANLPSAAELLLSWDAAVPEQYSERMLVAASNLGHSCFTLAEEHGLQMVEAIAAGLGFTPDSLSGNGSAVGTDSLLAMGSPLDSVDLTEQALHHKDAPDICTNAASDTEDEFQATDMAMSPPASDDEEESHPVQSLAMNRASAGTQGRSRSRSPSPLHSDRSSSQSCLSRSRSRSPSQRYVME
jgi:hypothetical protein